MDFTCLSIASLTTETAPVEGGGVGLFASLKLERGVVLCQMRESSLMSAIRDLDMSPVDLYSDLQTFEKQLARSVACYAISDNHNVIIRDGDTAEVVKTIQKGEEITARYGLVCWAVTLSLLVIEAGGDVWERLLAISREVSQTREPGVARISRLIVEAHAVNADLGTLRSSLLGQT